MEVAAVGDDEEAKAPTHPRASGDARGASAPSAHLPASEVEPVRVSEKLGVVIKLRDELLDVCAEKEGWGWGGWDGGRRRRVGAVEIAWASAGKRAVRPKPHETSPDAPEVLCRQLFHEVRTEWNSLSA